MNIECTWRKRNISFCFSVEKEKRTVVSHEKSSQIPYDHRPKVLLQSDVEVSQTKDLSAPGCTLAPEGKGSVIKTKMA